MDKLAEKLAKRYELKPEQAQALVDAGYKSPKYIIGASDADLQEVDGIGAAAVQKLRR